MTVLENLSEGLAAAVEEASPYVAQVDGRRRLPASGIVWSAEGIVVTAHHVLEREENITVGLHGGGSADAELVGRDPTTDLAVLRADASGLEAPHWGEPDGLRVGHLVLGLGRPGKSVRATMGVVSALGEAWRTPAGGKVDRYVQTDLAMYPGFSGGPLVDTQRRVVGLNTSMLLRGATIALPVPTIRQVVESILTHGKVRRGYLGVGTYPARLPEGLAQQAGQETGLLISSVEPGSPADSGGLLLGDVMVAIEGHPTRAIHELQAVLGADSLGKAVAVRIARGGQLRDVRVAIGER